MPQLTALYFPRICRSIHRDTKELALQVLDIVSIRPELKITYVGLETKCYQILEAGPVTSDSDFDENNLHSEPPSSGGDDLADSDDDPLDTTDDDAGSTDAVQNADLLSNDSSTGSDDYDTEADYASRMRLRIQEILFYDDKVSIFKMRHGVL